MKMNEGAFKTREPFYQISIEQTFLNFLKYCSLLLNDLLFDEILFTSTEQFYSISFLEVMAGGLSLLY